MATLLLRNLLFGDSPAGETGDLLIRDGAIVERGPALTFAPGRGQRRPCLPCNLL